MFNLSLDFSHMGIFELLIVCISLIFFIVLVYVAFKDKSNISLDPIDLIYLATVCFLSYTFLYSIFGTFHNLQLLILGVGLVFLVFLFRGFYAFSDKKYPLTLSVTGFFGASIIFIVLFNLNSLVYSFHDFINNTLF